jgi:hypothetical protein
MGKTGVQKRGHMATPKVARNARNNRNLSVVAMESFWLIFPARVISTRNAPIPRVAGPSMSGFVDFTCQFHVAPLMLMSKS